MNIEHLQRELQAIPSVTAEEELQLPPSLERLLRLAEHREDLERRVWAQLADGYDKPSSGGERWLVISPEHAARAGLQEGDLFLGCVVRCSGRTKIRAGNACFGKTTAGLREALTSAAIRWTSAASWLPPEASAPLLPPPPPPRALPAPRSPGTRARARWKRLRRSRR